MDRLSTRGGIFIIYPAVAAFVADVEDIVCLLCLRGLKLWLRGLVDASSACKDLGRLINERCSGEGGGDDDEEDDDFPRSDIQIR